MLVVEAERFGGPQVLTARQAPDPIAGPGQVVVRQRAAADAHAALESRLAVAKTLLHP
jgi:NADPH:quinone reductase-like Zn-dependent oxidoreductase